MKIFILISVVFFSFLSITKAQKHYVYQFSFASDLGVVRNVAPNQKAWAVTPDIVGHFSFTPKTGAYIKGQYFNTYHHHENLWAVAKDASLPLKKFDYYTYDTLKSTMLLLGLKEYVVGAYNRFKGTNAYVFAGLGINFARFYTSYQVYDTSIRFNPVNYVYPIEPGHNRYKQPIAELGFGLEKHLGLDIFLYGEAKSLYSFTNSTRLYHPRTGKGFIGGGVSLGLRLLF